MKANKIRWAVAAILLMGAAQLHAQAMFPDITVNLTFPQFQRLKTDGGFVYLDGGLKGIILYRSGEGAFNAYDRACPYHPSANCATVQVDGSTLYMVDRCCNSSFSFPDGQPTGGPAVRPLIQYRIEISGNTLKISDEIIN
ncbi:MAG: hypothetical protein JST43_11070 [Bacteroidetes bacterium]|nr:hypothetical protein [Bacteroidota bacterium]MBS1540076.1 hypothetical protein [Bacteroidota bacterium]